MLDHKTLLELLDYDPATGIFQWKIYYGRAVPGKQAGSIKDDGHRLIVINGTKYKAARLAWLYMTKAWPQNIVDHIDADPSNDKWDNLRDVTQSVNMRNQYNKTNSRNKSGYRGVMQDYRGRWRAQFNGKFLGSFKTPEEAYEKYMSHMESLNASPAF